MKELLEEANKEIIRLKDLVRKYSEENEALKKENKELKERLFIS